MTKRLVIDGNMRPDKDVFSRSCSNDLTERVAVTRGFLTKRQIVKRLFLLLSSIMAFSVLFSTVSLSTLPQQALAETNADNQNKYGLLFDTSSGTFYLDFNGNGAIDSGEPVYNPPSGTATWAPSTNTLTLNGFNWSTSAPTAFREVNPSYTTPLTLYLVGTNSITSTYSGNGYTHGMFMSSPELVIDGTGVLTTTGGDLVGDGSYSTEGINAGSITIKGGELCAFGGNGLGVSIGIGARSLTVEGGVLYSEGGNTAASFGAWAGEVTVSGGTLFATGNSAHWGDSKGLVFSIFTFEGGVIKAQGENCALGFDPYSSTPKVMTVSALAYSYWVNIAPSSVGTPIQVFNGVGSGTPYVFDVSHLSVGIETLAVYNVSVSAGTGGTVSAGSGQYPVGHTLSITATAGSGYSFSGWTATGITLADPSTATITISVPQGDAVLVASFKADNKSAFGASDGSSIYLIIALCLIILAGILLRFFRIKRKQHKSK